MKLFPFLTLCIPPSKIKNRVLNLFNNKQIDLSAYIGFSFINVNNLVIDRNVRIKHFVRMNGIERIHLKENSYIGNHNTLYCALAAGDHGHFTLGENSELVRQNALDLTSNITIGNNVVVGGFGSQLWTHGFDVDRNRIQGEIIIGDNVYIGSSSIFNLGVSVCSNVSIGAGSVVCKSIKECGLHAGAPAIKKNDKYLIVETDSIKLIAKKEGSHFFEKKL